LALLDSPYAACVTALIADRLRERARRNGADPLLTYYDLASGERTELSAISFLNWVDKTSNLFVEEYDIEAADVVEMPLARDFPGHWMTLVIELAAWQVGATVHLQAEGPTARLLVLGPDLVGHGLAGNATEAGSAVLACTLHPLGLGFDATLPPGVDDFSLEVRGQPDLYVNTPRSGPAAAWVDAERRLTQADLVEVGLGPGGRRLVRVSDPWTTVRDGLLVPLVTNGSTVIVAGDDPGQLHRIIETERVTR